MPASIQCKLTFYRFILWKAMRCLDWRLFVRVKGETFAVKETWRKAHSHNITPQEIRAGVQRLIVQVVPFNSIPVIFVPASIQCILSCYRFIIWKAAWCLDWRLFVGVKVDVNIFVTIVSSSFTKLAWIYIPLKKHTALYHYKLLQCTMRESESQPLSIWTQIQFMWDQPTPLETN